MTGASVTTAALRGPATAPAGLPELAKVMARAAGENFPVALRVLPRGRRADLLSIYAYARLVDEVGDAYAGDRLAALDWVDRQLDQALRPDAGGRGAAGSHPAVAGIAERVRRWGDGEQPLRDLVTANRVDQSVHRYPTFEDLVGYCRLSADPVGRLVLLAFGASDERRVGWSDRICTALQLAEHWQDLAEDLRAGRCYLPAEDLERFGVDLDQLVAAAFTGGPIDAAARGLVAFEVARARRLLAEGEPLVADLDGWARLSVAGFAAGGRAALDAVAAAGFDPFSGAPHPGPAATVLHAARLLRHPGGRP